MSLKSSAPSFGEWVYNSVLKVCCLIYKNRQCTLSNRTSCVDNCKADLNEQRIHEEVDIVV